MKYLTFKIISAVCLCGVASGETLQQVVEKAMESQYIKSKSYEVKAAEGEIIKAKTLPNPDVYLEFGRLAARNNQTFGLTELQVSQPLLLYGIRDIRTQGAVYSYEALKHDFEVFKRNFISDIYSLFYDALYNKELLNISRQEFEFSEDIYNFVKKTYQLGEISKVDLLRSEKDYNLAKINLQQQELRYRQAVERLSATIGYRIEDVEGNFSDVKMVSTLDFEQLPEFKSIKSSLSSLESQENLYRALRKPQISLAFISREVFRNNYEAGFFVSANLPVFNRYVGEMLSIKNRKHNLETYMEYNLKNYSTRFEIVKNTQQVLMQQIKELDQNIIPSLNQQLQLANKSYKLKVITLFELTSIKNDYYQTLRYRFELLNQLHKNYAEYIKIGGSL